MALKWKERETVITWTMLVLVIVLLFLVSACASLPARDTDHAWALPDDWQYKVGIDSPVLRPGYFAVHKDWLKEQM